MTTKKKDLPVTCVVAHTGNNGATWSPLPCTKTKQLISGPRSSPGQFLTIIPLLPRTLFVHGKRKRVISAHNLLLYRSAALLTLDSICVHKHLICQHCLQKSQAFWTSTLHTALITAPVISSARS